MQRHRGIENKVHCSHLLIDGGPGIPRKASDSFQRDLRHVTSLGKHSFRKCVTIKPKLSNELIQKFVRITISPLSVTVGLCPLHSGNMSFLYMSLRASPLLRQLLCSELLTHCIHLHGAHHMALDFLFIVSRPLLNYEVFQDDPWKWLCCIVAFSAICSIKPWRKIFFPMFTCWRQLHIS